MAWGPSEHQQGLLAGGELFRHVVAGGELEPMPSAAVGLPPDEQVFADLPLEYTRYYGMDVPYQQWDVSASGSAGFVLGALAVTAAGNAIARNRAQAQSAAQWREHQVARVVATDERLMIFTRTGPLSFWHSGLNGFMPYPDEFRLVLTFPDCEPVQLRGPGVPWLAVAMARLIYPPDQISLIPGFAGMSAWLRSIEGGGTDLVAGP